MGDRGTGKSTIVRALVDLLPPINVVENDPYNSDPFDPELMSDEVLERLKKNEKLSIIQIKTPMIDLPLGATEDRVCGTIDIEKAISEGKKAFEPGLLAQANRGILYVREGISICHPARFILVGSGNPEEGELRPQLLDRFGMHAQIKTLKEPKLRVKIVQQRELFEKNPKEFKSKYQEEQNKLIEKIAAARKNIRGVNVKYEILEKISQICSELNVDGLRGDMVTSRAAKALAAFENQEEVSPKHVFTIITLCLRHRLRKDPLQTIDSGQTILQSFYKTFNYN
jgi:magnesium chelatase subunit I